MNPAEKGRGLSPPRILGYTLGFKSGGSSGTKRVLWASTCARRQQGTIHRSLATRRCSPAGPSGAGVLAANGEVSGSPLVTTPDPASRRAVCL